MRRVLAAVAVATMVLVSAACQPAPAPTLTATPSTTAPGCKTITTVTGKLTPANTFKELNLEYQKTDGTWHVWIWFATGASGEGMDEITAKPNQTTGNYSLTYFSPTRYAPGGNPVRLRIHAKKLEGPEATSKSWYVTRPAC